MVNGNTTKLVCCLTFLVVVKQVPSKRYEIEEHFYSPFIQPPEYG